MDTGRHWKSIPAPQELSRLEKQIDSRNDAADRVQDSLASCSQDAFDTTPCLGLDEQIDSSNDAADRAQDSLISCSQDAFDTTPSFSSLMGSLGRFTQVRRL